MANKKKAATAVVAVATAAALLLGGTFAWQSISQTALNEASDVINPGGRLHNDLWYVDAKTTNNDIYVENFAEDEIFARVRLSEYMEIVMNYGTAAEKVENVAGSKTLKDGTGGEDAATAQNQYDYEYTTHYFHEENTTDEYWTWDTDGSDAEETYYMPTFNLNKDSLAPDLNGLYAQRVGGISNREAGQYVDAEGNALENYEGYTDGDTKEGYEIYDGDTNSDDELKTLDAVALEEIIANGTAQYGENIVLTDAREEHIAKPVGQTKGLISLTDWLAKVDGNDDGVYDKDEYIEADHGGYWVYDDGDDGDGWVYWSSPIAGKNNADDKSNTTGLLLDSFALKDVMDDTWYYAIEVTGQFITANDLGEPAASTFSLRNTEDEGTGFYRGGERVSENALLLLALIGVDTTQDEEDGSGGGGDEPWVPEYVDLELKQDTSEYELIYVDVYEYIKPSNWGELTFKDEDGNKLLSYADDEVNYQYDTHGDTYVYVVDYNLEGQQLTLTVTDDEGNVWGAYVFVGEPELPEMNEKLLFDGGKRNTIYPGNTYELSYTGEDDATFAVTTGSAAASIDGSTLTVNGDAKEYTYVAITITKSDGTTDTANVMVSHEIQFKTGETVLKEWDQVLINTPITAWWGNEQLRNITARDGYDGDADLTELLTIDEENGIVTAKKGDWLINVSATYEPLGVKGDQYLEISWIDSVEVSYTITKTGGETVNGTISDDEANRNEVVFISAGDTVTFTASSSGEKTITLVEWFIGENGNSASQNTAAFGEMTPDPYDIRDWSGTLTNTAATYTIPNVAAMEEMLDYHIYVHSNEHNYRWFQLILGEPAIDCKSTVEAGGSTYLSTNDMKEYTFAITVGGEYAQLGAWDELIVSEDAPIGTQITVTATPDGHDGPVLTKTITVVEGDGEETPVVENETISAEVMQLQDTMITVKDENGELITDVGRTNVYNTMYVRGDDADLVGFANNVDATPDAVIWVSESENAEGNYDLYVGADAKAEDRTYYFTLVHTAYDDENNEILVENPVELTVTATPFSMTGADWVNRGESSVYTLTLPENVELSSVNGHIQGHVEDLAAGTAFAINAEERTATFTVDAAEPNDELQLWIGCDLTDGTNYYYYVDVQILDEGEVPSAVTG